MDTQTYMFQHKVLKINPRTLTTNGWLLRISVRDNLQLSMTLSWRFGPIKLTVYLSLYSLYTPFRLQMFASILRTR